MQFLTVMTINERFEAIINALFNGNKRAFAKAVGISPTVVENVVGARKGKPSYDVLVKVCSNANISAEWLLLGGSDDIKNVFEIRRPLRLYSPEDGDNEIITDFIPGTPKPIKESPEPENSALISHLDNKIKEKDFEIGELHEEIGALKARIKQLEEEAAKMNTPRYATQPTLETSPT